MRFEYLISEKGKRVPGMERLVRNCQRPEGGCSPLPAQQQGAGVGHEAGAAHAWGWRCATPMLDLSVHSPYCQAPPAQIRQAARRPALRCGCRPTFATQNRCRAAEPASFRSAFHTRCGVVPVDDESTRNQTLFGSHPWCRHVTSSLPRPMASGVTMWCGPWRAQRRLTSTCRGRGAGGGCRGQGRFLWGMCSCCCLLSHAERSRSCLLCYRCG